MQGVLYEIHVDCQKDGFDIINEMDNSSYDDDEIYNCDVSWSNDYLVLNLWATIPEEWDEDDATEALEDLLDDLDLDYDYFDTSLE